MNCEREFCGHPVDGHNRGARCGQCPCPIAIVDSEELKQPRVVQYKLGEGGGKQPPKAEASGETVTVRYLRQKFFDAAETTEGTTCPVCERFGKVYVRKLNSTMAHGLILLYARGREGQWVDVRERIGADHRIHADFGKLAYWGLIENKPNDSDPTKRTSGVWRITKSGAAFVQMLSLVPEKAVVYDGTVKRFEGSNVSIREVLGEAFNYSELMEAAASRVDLSDVLREGGS